MEADTIELITVIGLSLLFMAGVLLSRKGVSGSFTHGAPNWDT